MREFPGGQALDRHSQARGGVFPLNTRDALCIAALLVVAWWLYRPDVLRAVDYVDFPENILLMKERRGFVAQFLAMMETYEQHGRWQPISLAVLVAQWSFFDSWTPGWHLVRFALLSAVIVLAYSLHRRLGLGTAGAGCATALLVVAPPAVNAWTRLSTGEPLGTLFVVIACHAALDTRSRAMPWVVAAMFGCVIWTKEVMAPAFLLPLLLAVTARSPGDLSLRGIGAAQVKRLVPALLVLVVTATPVLRVLASSETDAFAARYGSGRLSLVDLFGSTIAAWLPILPAPGNPRPVILIGLTLLVVAAGWLTAFRHAERRGHHMVVLLAAVGIPIAGAITYGPWPHYLLIYALPFMLPGSLLIGQAVSSLSSARQADRAIAAICLVTVLTFSAAAAANTSARTTALHDAFAVSVRLVAEAPGVDSVMVGVAADQFDQRGNFGPRFSLYARMLGLEWPPVRDVTCEEAARTNRARVLVLAVSEMCPLSASGEAMVVVTHTRYDWPNPLPHPDSVTVALGGLDSRMRER
jgi:hypothetical protein